MEFHEARRLAGNVPPPILAFVGSLLAAGGLVDRFPLGWRILLVVIGAGVIGLLWGRVETVVDGHVLTTGIPPLWRSEIDLLDVTSVDVVGVLEPSDLLTDDHAVALSEGSGWAPLTRSGAAVRIELRDGRVREVYSRRPQALREAIEAGRAA